MEQVSTVNARESVEKQISGKDGKVEINRESVEEQKGGKIEGDEIYREEKITRKIAVGEIITAEEKKFELPAAEVGAIEFTGVKQIFLL